ncbi:hypothetical protein QPM17_23175 [Marinobacter sp. TBZ242]|uniref:Uncharacterized protein n=1 Tax=Marinobacter azerbaijanicus TaxID=3050455 RepID=A0ABT7IIN5_9GAMM|nr:hypothetical protein [Marinobacter sp. TBZ242]MDL0434047.1 hypothetical protein [Marinobacter sp. TBZ242]
MAQDITPQEAIKRLEQHFGDRKGMLIHTLMLLSTSGQPADFTFYKRKPILSIRVSAKLGVAQLYGLKNHVPRVLRRIEFSNGMVASLSEIWTINPMPVDGFTQEELDNVDLSLGEQRVGPQGETVRKMIRKTYHCKSHKETDYYLRRWIAS